MKNFLRHISHFLNGRVFFWLIISLAAIQGVWYAFSFQPILFDERAHLDFVYLYSEHKWPIITEQNPAWDALGDVTRENSYLYFYLMALPLQIIQVFTGNETVQILAIRLAHLLIFIIGLFLIRNIVLRLSLPEKISNFTILSFILIPAVAPLAGVATYDIPAFTLFMLMLLWAIEFLLKKDFDIKRFVGVFAIAGLIGVIKYSAIALALPICLYLLSVIFTRYGKDAPHVIRVSFQKLSLSVKIGISLIIVVSSLLVVERPLANLIMYGDVTPDCELVLSEERCYDNYVAKRNLEFEKSKPDNFSPINPINFFYMYWIPDMVKTSAQQVPGVSPFPFVFLLLHAGLVLFIIVSLLNARKLVSSKPYTLLVLVCLFYIIVLFAQQYVSYVKLGQPVALSGRYLLPIFPLMLILTFVSIVDLLRQKYTNTKLLLTICVFFILSTQGGGALTHALSVKDQGYYWQNDMIIRLNQDVRSKIEPFVIEREL